MAQEEAAGLIKDISKFSMDAIKLAVPKLWWTVEDNWFTGDSFSNSKNSRIGETWKWWEKFRR